MKHNEMTNLTWVMVVVAAARFLLDGITIKAFGNSFIFGHVDASVYIAILTPVLGAHSFIKHNVIKKEGNESGKQDKA